MRYESLLTLLSILFTGVFLSISTTLFVTSACSAQAISGDAKEVKAVKSFAEFLSSYVSQEYIRIHFRLKGSLATDSGPTTLTYVLTYSGIQARTRTAGEQGEALISGLARFSPGGTIQSYFGPLKEYEVRIERDKAESIMKQKGCVFEEDSVAVPPVDSVKPADRIHLFIGDYYEKDGKYSPDYIPEGFYWSGGRPDKGDRSSHCMVDAETGKFGTWSFAPH